MEPRKELASIIKRARLESGLKQEIFAREVGVVAAHLSRLEHGQGLPSIRLIRKIADRFGADRGRMMGLLRRIKGFEDGEELDGDGRRHDGAAKRTPRGATAPVLLPTDLEPWVAPVGPDGRPDPIEREPLGRTMTKDKHAFWVVARGRDMCGGPIGELDLLLVEPSRSPVDGRPALVLLDGRVMVRKYRDLGDTIVLDPACSGQDELPPIPREVFRSKGGVVLRLAGYRPAFQPFGAAGKAGRGV